MAIKEPEAENWLTPENMKIYIEHLNMVDEYIEMEIERQQLERATQKWVVGKSLYTRSLWVNQR